MSKKIASGNQLRIDRGGVESLGLPRDRDGFIELHVARSRRPMRVEHRHAEWEFNLVARGWAEYVVDGRRVALPRDTLIWLLPRQLHLLIDRSSDLEMWVGVFRPALVRRLSRDEPFDAWRAWLRTGRPVGPSRRVLAEASALQLSKLCGQVAERHAHAGHLSAGLAWLLGEAWAAFVEADDVPEGTHLHPAVQRAARLLHDDPALDDLDALADACHLSRPHLSRLFRSQIGQSITDYRNRQRVDRFAALVGRGGRVSLTQAAYAAGFGSYAQAFRVVRQVTGHSPRAWLGK